MRFIINKLWQFKLPVTLISIIALALVVGPHLPVQVQSFLHFLSLTVEKFLLFALPFIIFSLILSSLVHLKGGGALKLVLVLLPLMCLSNYIAIWIAYFAGDVIVRNADLMVLTEISTRNLEPTWHFSFPHWLTAPQAMIAAVIFAFLSSKYFPRQGQKISQILSKITVFILNKIILPALPLMILGIVIKMQYDGILHDMAQGYAFIFMTVALLQITYIVATYFLINKFKIKDTLTNLKNMFPALITAFSTMSSAITMPLTLIATRKNVHDPDVVNFVIPSTVNFHLIGDCLAMPIFSLAIMYSFGYEFPTFSQYLIFSIYYLLARFSAAGIPGGGALILMPLLDSQFHFTSNMLGLIPTMNLVFDPMITAMNVLANGAFAILFYKTYRNLKNVERENPRTQAVL